MSMFEEVPEDLAAKLERGEVRAPTRTTKKKTFHETTGAPPRTFESYAGREITLHECPNCGWCEHPGKCVWSFECPICSAKVGEHCTHTSGRITTLHRERWELHFQEVGKEVAVG